MKNILLFFFIMPLTSFVNRGPHLANIPLRTSDNLVVITIDGFRWQEVFRGADSILLQQASIGTDNKSIRDLYWDENYEGRRKKLLPFFWNSIAKGGQLYGNRDEGNRVAVSNIYALSYPGYNEIFTGTTDLSIHDNSKKNNPNINVLEFLSHKARFRDRIAVFSSWNVFPYILNQKRNRLRINAEDSNTLNDNNNENEIPDCRADSITINIATKYIRENQPKIIVIGLGETDEYAHEGRYDAYLRKANELDHRISKFWDLLQSLEQYKNKTTLMITTDHGRGRKDWSNHGFFVSGSRETWLALFGAGVKSLKANEKPNRIYNKQFARIIANLVGEDFPR